LSELQENLQTAQAAASMNMASASDKYFEKYNSQARSKSFEVDDDVLVLLPSSSHKFLNSWTGPGKVIKILSPVSYRVKLDNGSKRDFHADNLRPYHYKVQSVGLVLDSPEEEESLGEVVGCPLANDTFDEDLKAVDVSHLSPGEQSQLLQLLRKFHHIFTDKLAACNTGCLHPHYLG